MPTTYFTNQCLASHTHTHMLAQQLSKASPFLPLLVAPGGLETVKLLQRRMLLDRYYKTSTLPAVSAGIYIMCVCVHTHTLCVYTHTVLCVYTHTHKHTHMYRRMATQLFRHQGLRTSQGSSGGI